MQSGAIQIEVINRSAYQFKTSKPGDVGYDLHANVKWLSLYWYEKVLSILVGKPCCILWPIAGTRNVSSQIWLNMPDQVWCQILPRSSVLRRKIHILGGTIDSQYQGELFSNFHNFGLLPRLIMDGERYAQVVFFNAIRPHFAEVYRFKLNTVRGASGFGSSGR